MKTIYRYDHKITFGFGSSSGNPEYKGMQTCDIKLWVKFDNLEWFKPYGRFKQEQILTMIDICDNEYQLISLFKLLSANIK